MNISLRTIGSAVCATGLIALAGSPSAIAQQRTQPDAIVTETAMFELVLDRASELMGSTLYSRTGNELGEINDFLVSRRDGAVDSVIVRTGAVLGMGGKEVRVAYHSITWNSARNRLETMMNESALKALPEFSRDTENGFDLNNLPNTTRAEVWEQRRNNANGDRTKMYGDSYGPDRGILLSTVIGMDVDCISQSCGEIEDALVELHTGNVVFLVVDPDENFLGIADTLRLAPYTIASWDVDASEMRIDATRTQILNAPEFDGEMTPLTSRVRITEIYGVYDRPSPDLNARAQDRPEQMMKDKMHKNKDDSSSDKRHSGDKPH